MLKEYKKFFIVGVIILAFGFSAAVTALVTTNNRNNQLQAETTNQIVEVNLFENEVLPATVTLKVGQKMRINNKDSVARELFLGSGTAHDAPHDDNEVSHSDEIPHDESDAHSDNHKKDASHDHASGFSTGEFNPDEAWEGSFSEPGTYFLHDHENPDINILLVVYNEQ